MQSVSLQQDFHSLVQHTILCLLSMSARKVVLWLCAKLYHICTKTALSPEVIILTQCTVLQHWAARCTHCFTHQQTNGNSKKISILYTPLTWSNTCAHLASVALTWCIHYNFKNKCEQKTYKEWLYSLSLMYTLLDFSNSLSWIEPLGTNFGTVHDLMTPIKLVGIIHLRHSLLREIITGINDPPAQSQLGCQLQKLQPQAAGSAASNCRKLTSVSGKTCQLQYVPQQDGRAWLSRVTPTQITCMPAATLRGQGTCPHSTSS